MKLHVKKYISRLKKSVSPPIRKALESAERRDPIPPEVRRFVWMRDGGKCKHCGNGQDLQFDHVIPKSLGGADTAANVELLCRCCNLSKGATFQVKRNERS